MAKKVAINPVKFFLIILILFLDLVRLLYFRSAEAEIAIISKVNNPSDFRVGGLKSGALKKTNYL